MKSTDTGLKQRLQQRVKLGPKSDSPFDKMAYQFSKDLLSDLQTRTVKK